MPPIKVNKRAAVIDLGTNTFHLLIVEKTLEGFQEIYRERIFINLAENGIELIGTAAFDRGIRAINKYNDILKSKQVSDVRIYGTAALRTANNGVNFREEVKKQTGLQIQIIDGQREADLILKGTKLAIDLNHTTNLIMDIGGGSVEFILTKKGVAVYQESFPVGVAVLHKAFHREEPMGTEEIQNLKKRLNKQLSPLFAAAENEKIISLIGASGSFEVLQSIHAPNIHKNVPLETVDFERIAAQIIMSTEAQRLNIQGLPKQRVKLIVVAILLMQFVLRKLNIDRIVVSPYALKEGAIAEIFNI